MKAFENVNKIAVLRANALGDFIFSLPALYSLRNTYKNAEIVYIGREWHKKFIEERESPVDRVIVIPEPLDFEKNKKVDFESDESAKFFKKLQDEGFDITLQMHGGGKNSNPFLKKIGAKLTVGLKTPDADDLDLSVPYQIYQNEYIRYIEVASLIGSEPVLLNPKIKLTKKDFQESQELLSVKDPYVVIHAGASDIKRRWPVEYFAKTADFLSERGFAVYFTGKAHEQNLILDIRSKMKRHTKVLDLCGKFSIGGLAALIKESSLLISNDTGPLHLGIAVDAKTIGLFWCGNGIVSSPPLRKKHSVLLSWQITCPICSQNIASEYPFEKEKKCKHLTSFIKNISPEEVFSEIKSKLPDLRKSSIIDLRPAVI